MKEKRRCSILFHLLGPGGRWLTTMSSPSSLASFRSSRFHSRTREPLLPPPPAFAGGGGGVSSKGVAFGERPCPAVNPPWGILVPRGNRGPICPGGRRLVS